MLALGALIIPSRGWQPDATSRKVGVGLGCIWISGIYLTHPYQFILVLVGFLYLARGLIEALPEQPKQKS